MRLPLALALAASLAGCDNPVPTAQEPGGPIRTDEPARETSENAAAKITPVDQGDVPAPGANRRFIGLWAADTKMCESAPWRFTDTTLTTPAGSRCSFNRVTDVPGGYDIQATCTAEGPPASDTLKVRFAQSAGAMLFESEVIADAGLLLCDREG